MLQMTLDDTFQSTTSMSNSNTTTPENVGQPPDDSPESVEESQVATMVPEYVSTPHSSSECKKVYVESENDKLMLYALSIGQTGLDHDDEPLFLSNRNRGHVFLKTRSAHRGIQIFRKKSDVEQRSTTTIRDQDQEQATGHAIK
jgi:hypothetical protein